MIDLFVLLLCLNMYPKTMFVTEINYKADTVVCEDYTGNSWKFEGVEDWEVDDVVSAVMDSKGTKEIYDDEIVVARYGGNIKKGE